MGVEVGRDFGDLLEDLEPFVFEVDSAEADGLELAQRMRVTSPVPPHRGHRRAKRALIQ